MHGTISLDSIVTHSDQQVGCRVDSEVVLMSVENGEYYNLNPVASDIWEMLIAPASISQIVDMAMERYTVEQDICKQDILDLVNKLISKDLVKVVG